MSVKVSETDIARQPAEPTAVKGYLCPVCGEYMFEKIGDYDICEVCGWENDRLQAEDPDFAGGANEMSLNEAISRYREENQ